MKVFHQYWWNTGDGESTSYKYKIGCNISKDHNLTSIVLIKVVVIEHHSACVCMCIYSTLSVHTIIIILSCKSGV